VAKIGYNMQLTDFQTFSAIFTFFRPWNTSQTVLGWDFKKNPKILILPILAAIYKVKITFWKKLVEGAPITYFQIDIFLFYMLWGIQNQLRIFFAKTRPCSSLSMMCIVYTIIIMACTLKLFVVIKNQWLSLIINNYLLVYDKWKS
jgi:hypothetical protein